jgi:endonuclease III
MTTANECPRPRTLTASKRLSIKTSTKRVQNATEELQKYIEQFTDAEQTNPTATPISRCYGSSNVTLLSTKPKLFSSPKKHSRKAAISPEKQGKMVDNLVQWVNESYSKDLQRKIVPFGQRSNSSVDINSLSQTDGI